LLSHNGIKLNIKHRGYLEVGKADELADLQLINHILSTQRKPAMVSVSEAVMMDCDDSEGQTPKTV
jgi:hypothetical protein